MTKSSRTVDSGRAGCLIAAALVAGTSIHGMQTSAPARALAIIEAAWTPDGAAIVAHNKADREIWMLDGDGTHPRRITYSGTPAFHWYPMASPDRTHIVFGAFRDGRMRLYTVGIDGTGERDLGVVTSDRDQDPTRVSWSRDGSRLLYSANRNGKYEIHSARLDGSDDRFVTFGSAAVWSPDNTQIAFVAAPSSSLHLGLHLIGADGTGERQLTAPDDGNDLDPSWSAGGTRLVFLSERSGPPGVMDGRYPKQLMQIVSIGVDGSDRRALTGADDRLFEPAASPDGKWILYGRQERDAQGALLNHFMLMKPDGSGAHEIF